jgi:ATP-dependent helicase HrpB
LALSLAPLPIDALLPELVAKLTGANCLVLRAPPGAGKTTRVAPALLDAGLAGQKNLLLLQPRRLAARAAAERIAQERGVALGQEVGYQVRFERRAGPRTRILVMTDGMLLRRLQDDPFLEDVGCVVFDEFHERSLNLDLALAMIRRAQLELRPELRVVVMSATLAAGPVARFLGDCPQVEAEGRMFPVNVRYLRHARSEPLEAVVARCVAESLEQIAGHVLVFLPGQREIWRVQRQLESLARAADVLVMPLHGELPLAEQQAVLEPSAQRKIVLATNVAETSITIEGVTAVVDSGLARRQQFDPGMGINHLELCRISRAAADQRAGRAGRTGPGICLRLWTEREQQGMSDFEIPEVLRVDLAGPVLELLHWGEADPAKFAWFEPPPDESLRRAEVLLRRLGATDDTGLTPLGRQMVRLPVHPRIARLLLVGHAAGHSDEAALVAAMLSERDPLRQAERRQQPLEHWSASDVLDRMAIVEEFERGGTQSPAGGQLNRNAARFILRARDQLLRLLDQEPGDKGEPGGKGPAVSISAAEAVRRALFTAYPDRLARRRAAGSRRAVMVGGRGVCLAPESAVVESELFVCVEMQEIGQSEALVRQASAVERAWLPSEQLHLAVDLEFDPERERVLAVRRTRFEDLVIDEAPIGMPPGADAAEILAREAAARLQPSQWFDDEAQSFVARVDLLRRHMPELDWPPLAEDDPNRLLPELCQGCISFEDLRRKNVLPLLQGRLSSRQLATLDREAPLRIRVPSGSQIAVDYTVGKPPALAVRIQELYGLAETPRIAGGRVRLVLHLLAPNMRPQQVTDDLASFWANTYEQVRKDLKRRYPKHSWPDNPASAQAECAPGPRR